MTDEQRAELKRLAEVATPGPWFVGYWGGRCPLEHRHGTPSCQFDYSRVENYSPEGTNIAAEQVGRLVVRNGYDGAEIDEADARFIAAANPAAVLDLLAERDALATEVKRLMAVIAKADRDLECGATRGQVEADLCEALGEGA